MIKEISTDVQPLISSLKSMHRAASFGATASAMTVNQLRDVIDIMHSSYNSAHSSWSALSTAIGASDARSALTAVLSPVPADVSATLLDIQTSALDLVNAYLGSVYATGSPAWTYTASLVSGQIVGGHSEVTLPSGIISVVNARCSTLKTSLEAITPI